MKRPVIIFLLLGGIFTAFALLVLGNRASKTSPSGDGAPAVSQIASAPIQTTVQHSAETFASPTRSLQLVNEITRDLRNGSERERDHAFNNLLPQLIAQSPLDAGSLAEEWPAGPLREELFREVTRRWLTKDFAGAMTWLANLENQRDKRNAAESAVAQVAQNDPAGAVEVSQLFQIGTDDGSLKHLVQLWTEESPHEAVEWILSRSAGSQRDQLLSRIVFVRAQSDPVEAAALALHSIPAGPIQEEAVAAVSRQWAVRDTAAAEAWIDGFPPGPLRTRGMTEIEVGRKIR